MEVRKILVGDIHGCLTEFDELLKTIEYKQGTDELVLLGDLIDRGPDSVGVVRRAQEVGAKSIRGNHEVKFIRWFRSPKDKALYDRHHFYDKFSDEDINYIHQMPFYWKSGNIWAVHAGVKPGRPLEKQSEQDLCYLRYTDKERNFMSMKKVFREKDPRAMFWTDFGPFGADIVYGHNVHSVENVEMKKFDDGTICYGIDTGVCFGGRLTAMILDTMEVVQIQAKETYYKSDFTDL